MDQADGEFGVGKLTRVGVLLQVEDFPLPGEEIHSHSAVILDGTKPEFVQEVDLHGTTKWGVDLHGTTALHEDLP